KISFENMDYYGYTNTSTLPGMTYIVMHNNYNGFSPNTDPEGNQKGAAKATAIHEFKHAIQYVYNNWSSVGWFIEMDATWMEDIGYDQVNDYYNYLTASHIQKPGRSFEQGDGYEDCVWLHYISESHGVQTNLEIWNRIKSNPFESIYTTFDGILKKYSSSFEDALVNYFVWNTLTGDFVNEKLSGYEEADFYPTPRFCKSYVQIPDTSNGCARSQLSASYLHFISDHSNSPLNFVFESASGKNEIGLILNYNDGTSELKRIEMPQQNFIHYLGKEFLSELKSFVFVPVVLSNSSGDFSYSYEVSPFKSASFAHTPLKDTEQIGGREIFVTIKTPLDIAVRDSLKLNYAVEGSNYKSVYFLPTYNPDIYLASIPDLGYEVSINYFISIYDTLGNYLYEPSDGSTNPFTYYVGKDVISPSITVNKIAEPLTIYNFPRRLYVNIEDNIGLDSAFVEYRLNDNELAHSRFAEIRANLYSTLMDIDSTQLKSGDVIEYRLKAVDVSSNGNTAVIPETGFLQIPIERGFKFTSAKNKFIEDNNTISVRDTVTVNDDILIDDIDIYFKSSHQRFSDLEIKFKGATGTTKTWFQRPGLDTKYSNSGYANIIFDDEAEFGIDNPIYPDSTIAEGIFTPSLLDLSSYEGSSAKGKWIIYAYDRESGFSGSIEEWGLIIRGKNLTGIEEEKVQPTAFSLSQNYPNPFNPKTVIKFQVPSSKFIKLEVYDILGREIQTLVNAPMSAGEHEVTFKGSKLPSGVYIYTLKVNEFSQSRKMLLLK
ncbi:MAG: T9SS type A sorting domain-containing protein, partial [Bacteroidota bacterium]